LSQNLDNLFDSDTYRFRAESILEGISQEERSNWLQHPLTKSLLLTLKGDYLDYHSAWESGAFTSESSDGSSQQNAKALGSLEAIRLLANYIEDINSYDQSEGIQNPS